MGDPLCRSPNRNAIAFCESHWEFFEWFWNQIPAWMTMVDSYLSHLVSTTLFTPFTYTSVAPKDVFTERGMVILFSTSMRMSIVILIIMQGINIISIDWEWTLKRMVLLEKNLILFLHRPKQRWSIRSSTPNIALSTWSNAQHTYLALSIKSRGDILGGNSRFDYP